MEKTTYSASREKGHDAALFGKHPTLAAVAIRGSEFQ